MRMPAFTAINTDQGSAVAFSIMAATGDNSEAAEYDPTSPSATLSRDELVSEFERDIEMAEALPESEIP